MSGFYKNIAVIKEIKKGFSADGGLLSGVVRCEQYGGSLKVEVSLINFASLKEGRYVIAVGDGSFAEVFESGFEGHTLVNTQNGFAACVCYVLGEEVCPIAVALCGNSAFALPQLKSEVVRVEGLKVSEAAGDYHDEAIAEENYYEYDKANKDGGAVRSTQEKEEGEYISEDEKDLGAAKSFFESVRGEVNTILESYPVEENLTRLIGRSRFVKITYDKERYYVFGVIYGDERVEYLCYGVPATSDTPPESMKKMASFVPLSSARKSEGYWLTYQDAVSGKTLKRLKDKE